MGWVVGASSNLAVGVAKAVVDSDGQIDEIGEVRWFRVGGEGEEHGVGQSLAEEGNEGFLSELWRESGGRLEVDGVIRDGPLSLLE